MRSLRRTRGRAAAVAVALTAGPLAAVGGATGVGGAATDTAGAQWFDNATSATLTASANGFVDGYGREVVRRGFNSSGEAKLAEHGGLPFAGVADAQRPTPRCVG